MTVTAEQRQKIQIMGTDGNAPVDIAVDTGGRVEIASGISSIIESGSHIMANTNLITTMSSTVHTVTAASGGLCIASTNNIRTMLQVQNQKSGFVHISERPLQSGEGYIVAYGIDYFNDPLWKTEVYTGPLWAIANVSGNPVCTQEISIT